MTLATVALVDLLFIGIIVLIFFAGVEVLLLTHCLIRFVHAGVFAQSDSLITTLDLGIPMGVIALAMVVPAVLFRESVRATKKSLVSVWQYAMIFFLTLTSDFAFGLCATFLDLLVMAQDGSCGRYMKSGSCLELKAIAIVAMLVSVIALITLACWMGMMWREGPPLRVYVGGRVWTQDRSASSGWREDLPPPVDTSSEPPIYSM